MNYKVTITSLCCVLLILCLGCGQTYETQSIEVAPPSPNVVGIGGFQQFTVTAKMSNSKTQDVTNRATYVLNAPVSMLTVSATGRVQAIDGVCTWTHTGSGTTKTYSTSPFVLTATWDNHQSISFVSVSSLGGCDSPDTPVADPPPGPGTSPRIVYDVPDQYRYLLNDDGTLRAR